MGISQSQEESKQENSSNRNQVIKNTNHELLEQELFIQTSLLALEDPKKSSFKQQASETESKKNSTNQEGSRVEPKKLTSFNQNGSGLEPKKLTSFNQDGSGAELKKTSFKQEGSSGVELKKSTSFKQEGSSGVELKKSTSFKQEGNGQENKAMGGTYKKVPHMFETLIKQADPGSLPEHINSGIFLNKRTKKYWVDQETGCNCFMLFPRGLSIAWAEDRRYWQWFQVEDIRGTNIEIANLLNVCWLEVHGKINTSLLTPKTKYEVVFVVKMEELSYGWQTPVNLRLLFENGITHEQKVKLLELPRDQRKELKVGEIINSGEKAEEVEISLYEYNGGQWKRGLVIEGVIIRPNK
ncbi:protein PHLOEM PROTEIN 2-LIKE A1-like [Dioscorea cayenensis subsp. rotundata]|uniref:Protein PHLOEM PROTEIN 2-LIKE A1-like n=1 Tax=Dioscorea cayennensis subsp. rotundata TaxID=55577 RepID=A0AB40BYE5_DIOCR|nr:protein PHLOEM PROTEIN 2-LIKE A1-like [Dioscorea cayenensis subsp. rotundata]